MRCPKCHYISFDSNDRCRNCGYEFSLSADVGEMDLPIQTGDEAIGPLADFPLVHTAERASAAIPDVAADPERRPVPQDRSRVRRDPDSDAETAKVSRSRKEPDAGRRGASPPRDLPLFKEGDAPRVSGPVPPRPPLSVRRGAPAAARAAAWTPSDAPSLNLEMPDPHGRGRIDESASRAGQSIEDDAMPQGPVSAPAALRLGAALIDIVILGSINVVVLYFTLRICGLEFAEIVVLPPVPLLAFLLLLDGGYLIAFTTASGQTIGKMAAGIRVVPAAGDADRVPAHHAALRAMAYLVSVLPAGLGLLPALIGADGRAIHDRLADTRVVRA